MNKLHFTKSKRSLLLAWFAVCIGISSVAVHAANGDSATQEAAKSTVSQIVWNYAMQPFYMAKDKIAEVIVENKVAAGVVSLASVCALVGYGKYYSRCVNHYQPFINRAGAYLVRTRQGDCFPHREGIDIPYGYMACSMAQYDKDEFTNQSKEKEILSELLRQATDGKFESISTKFQGMSLSDALRHALAIEIELLAKELLNARRLLGGSEEVYYSGYQHSFFDHPLFAPKRREAIMYGGLLLERKNQLAAFSNFIKRNEKIINAL